MFWSGSASAMGRETLPKSYDGRLRPMRIDSTFGTISWRYHASSISVRLSGSVLTMLL
jgi:hypothetical protein